MQKYAKTRKITQNQAIFLKHMPKYAKIQKAMGTYRKIPGKYWERSRKVIQKYWECTDKVPEKYQKSTWKVK